MKIKLLTALVPVVLCANTVFAKSVVYNCGTEAGQKIVLEIEEDASNRYGFKGALSAPGQDSTTGTLIPSVTTNLVGSKESLEGTPIYHMHDTANASHQIMAEIVDSGKKADVLEIDAASGETIARRCTVKIK